jgi:hypothetical protein
MGPFLVVVGVIVALIGAVKIIVAAFSESAVWGIGSILLPIVALIFVFTHWEDGKSGLFWSVAGTVMMYAGFAISPGAAAARAALLVLVY